MAFTAILHLVNTFLSVEIRLKRKNVITLLIENTHNYINDNRRRQNY